MNHSALSHRISSKPVLFLLVSSVPASHSFPPPLPLPSFASCLPLSLLPALSLLLVPPLLSIEFLDLSAGRSAASAHSPLASARMKWTDRRELGGYHASSHMRIIRSLARSLAPDFSPALSHRSHKLALSQSLSHIRSLAPAPARPLFHSNSL
eukprot:6202715-Pleurochrysis_carterae.AAC.2